MKRIPCPDSHRPEVLAVTGKGGAGKTTFAAILARILAREGLRLLAVDADPSMNLTYALGARPVRTVGEMRSRLIEDPGERTKFSGRHTRDVMREEVLIELDAMDLLVLGRAEGPGCYCGLNQLLKFGIQSLAKQYQVTLIDCEAGIEQVNRRVIDSISTLVVLSDPTVKGLRTAAHLQEIATRYGVKGPYRSVLVLNRIGERDEALENKAEEMGLQVVGRIPPDDNITDYDRVGRPTIDLPDDSPSVVSVRAILERLIGPAEARPV